MKFTAITHEDVYGKKQKYLVLEISNGQKHLVNIGDKTYEAVLKLVESELAHEITKKANQPQVK